MSLKERKINVLLEWNVLLSYLPLQNQQSQDAEEENTRKSVQNYKRSTIRRFSSMSGFLPWLIFASVGFTLSGRERNRILTVDKSKKDAEGKEEDLRRAWNAKERQKTLAMSLSSLFIIGVPRNKVFVGLRFFKKTTTIRLSQHCVVSVTNHCDSEEQPRRRQKKGSIKQNKAHRAVGTRNWT